MSTADEVVGDIWEVEPGEEGCEFMISGALYATAEEFGNEAVWVVRNREPWPSPMLAAGTSVGLSAAKAAASAWLRKYTSSDTIPPSPLRSKELKL